METVLRPESSEHVLRGGKLLPAGDHWESRFECPNWTLGPSRRIPGQYREANEIASTYVHMVDGS